MKSKDAFTLPTWEQRGAEYVRRLMHDLDLTAEQAAGLVGNLGYESGEFKKMQEGKPMIPGSRGGYGVAQWTGPRRRAFEAWARKRSLAVNTDEANYGFLLHELQGSHKSFTARLRDTETVAEASRLTHVVYENPADVADGTYRSGPARQAMAVRALNGLQGEPPAKPPIETAIDLDLLADIIRAAQRVVGAAPDGVFGRETAAKIKAAQQGTRR